eukprot:GHRQ01018564.1.p1 GENE.GHRQ01018564.1~~GHRQ01018564.1.p1  ORF type:complete len:103 (+),score=24.28 GHRQ01018564.1:385-693(+)
MAFIKRLMDHLLNQVLVETLANSRWFQRFAVYTHKLSKEAAEKSKDHSKVLDEHVSTVMDKAKQYTAKVGSCRTCRRHHSSCCFVCRGSSLLLAVAALVGHT